MSLRINVPGAADSGRNFRPEQVTLRKPNWLCPECRGMNKGAWLRCLTKGCNAKRP
jgi:hypothetical protein